MVVPNSQLRLRQTFSFVCVRVFNHFDTVTDTLPSTQEPSFASRSSSICSRDARTLHGHSRCIARPCHYQGDCGLHETLRKLVNIKKWYDIITETFRSTIRRPVWDSAVHGCSRQCCDEGCASLIAALRMLSCARRTSSCTCSFTES